MSAIGFVRRALAMGVDLETALKMGEAFEAEMPVYVPAKSKAAQRTERWRERKASQTVTEASPPSPSVTDRHQASPCDAAKDAPAPVHTRGEDNPSRLEILPNPTSPFRASEPDLDWPESEKPSRAYLDRLQAALAEAAGPALASFAVAPKLASLAVILALGRPGKGPACDLQADVLPTIWARSVKAAPGSIKGWEFYREACLEARDRRLAGAGAVTELRPNARGSPSVVDRIADDRRRATEMTLASLKANG